VIFGGGVNRKYLAVAVIVLFLLTSSLSPVYAGFTSRKSTSIENIYVESTNIDIRPPLDRESFLDRCDSSEIEESYRNNPYLHRHDQHNPIRKPTVLDGVDGSWDIVVPDDYQTIQEAINHAEMGFRIFVRSGVYTENVEVNWVPSITLHGESKETTIVDGAGVDDVIQIDDSADGINISGFTIRNSGDENYGILISSNYNIIQDNILENNNVGIKLQYSSGNQIWDNEIKDNSEDGVLLHRSYANNISGNTITNNGVNGIEFTYSSLGTILDNNEISNHDENGIYIDESSLGNMFTRCTIKANNYGVLCAGVSDGNIFHHNAFLDNFVNAFDSSLDTWDYNGLGNYWDDYDGVDVDGDGVGDTPYVISGGKNKDCFPLMNQVMMYDDFKSNLINNAKFNFDCTTVSTGISSNNDGWDITVPDDYSSIQEAVDHAHPGDRIFVRSDVYDENINISTPDLTIHGEDKESTIIDGGGEGHVVFVSDVADGFNISGFTIRSNGKHFTGLYLYSESTCVENIIFQECNIGLALRDNKDNIVRNCEFFSNDYGIWTWMCTNSTLEDNVIEHNSLDGMALQWSTSLNISSNDIGNNSFDGILEICCSEILIGSNDICGNGEFGLQMFSSSNNIVEENTIENSPHDGISLSKSTNNTLNNNKVNRNGASGVALWYISNGNCIEYNEITSNHNGIFVKFSSNNIIHNNTNSKNGVGIYFLSLSNTNMVSNNNISNNTWMGSVFLDSNDNTVKGNYIVDNRGEGILLEPSSHNTISLNIISNNTGMGILSEYSINNTIINNIVSNNSRAIEFQYSSINTISNNIIINNSIRLSYPSHYNIITSNYILDSLHGIIISDSDNNTIQGNTISGKNRSGHRWEGIWLISCNYNIISRNNISNMEVGINLDLSCHISINSNTIINSEECGIGLHDYSRNNAINNNLILDNGCGIGLSWSSDNIITGNTISNHNYGGILLSSSNNNLLYNNNLINNSIYPFPFQARDDGNNTWDNRKLGNYWDDYEEKYPDAHRRLLRPWIWNKPYDIPGGNNTDRFPLSIPYSENNIIFILSDLFHRIFNFDWHPSREPYDIGG
jgi:parallel beta-helix repeat protein